MVCFLCAPVLVPAQYRAAGAGGLRRRLRVAAHRKRRLHHAVADAAAIWRRLALCASDLAGAALGCLGIIFVLLVIDPVSATLGIGALAAGAGWMVVRGSGDVRALRLSGAVALSLGAVAIVHAGLDISGKSHLGVFWAKGAQQTGTLFERWNTYSRVRVTALGESIPFGWGFARAPDEQDRAELSRHRR